MTTEQATARLAKMYRTGDADSHLDRSAEKHLWASTQHAAAWNWTQADHSLEAAYHVLGAEPPDATADELERGKHPIQVEAERQYRDEMGDA